MEEIRIRRAKVEDIRTILEIYGTGRSFMRRTGNMTQWRNGYPGETEAMRDMQEGNLFVGTDSAGEIRFVFTFIIGEEPTYRQIEGAWINEDVYGTIHRIASDGKQGRVLEKCVKFCLNKIPNLRIDTHKDNMAMLNAIRRCGFRYCGIIRVADGTPRDAFQLLSGNR